MALTAEPLAPERRRVVSRHRESVDTITLVLERDGADVSPGQFAMLLAPGVGEVPISYSRIGHDTVEHTIRSVGAVTAALVRTGTHALTRGPYGRGWDLERARGRDVVVVAGGLGVAPVRPVVDTVLAERGSFGRLLVVVGARDPDMLLFGDDLRVWGREDLVLDVIVDHARPSWTGRIGFVTDALARHQLHPDAAAFVCGPEVMMARTAEVLVDSSLDPGSIQVSLERNMRCGVGLCGHCQLGPMLLCRDGPVATWDRVAPLLEVMGL